MSVAIPIIDSIDGASRRIFLKAGVSDYLPIEDLYHEYRYRRRTDESLRRWEPLLRADGNVSKGSGRFTPRYITLLDGTKIVPFNEILQVNQLGEIITDNPDVDATIYDLSGITVGKPIFILPSEAEIINLDDEEIKNQSYLNGNVYINKALGLPEGIGTPTDPVDDFDAAYIVATGRKLNGYHLNGSQPLNNLDLISGTNWFSNSPDNGMLAFTNVGIEKSTFTLLDIAGSIASGRATFFDCIVGLSGNVTGFDGFLDACGIAGTISLHSGATMPIVLRDCISLVAGDGKPILDCDSVSAPISIRRQTGGLEIQNFNAGGDMSIDAAGVVRLKIASTCTAGTIVVGGNILLDDQSGAGCTVVRASTVQDVVWRNIEGP